MRNFTYIFFIAAFLLSAGKASAQGATCATANPFCVPAGGFSIPSTTGQPSLGGGGIYGCLGSTPNPVWYFMEMSTAGNVVINLSQNLPNGTGIDVDFVAWGPFPNLNAGCGGLAANNIVDCSYSAAAVEQININNVQPGQVYVLLVTNFNGGAGTINFNNGPGNTANTNCGIVPGVVSNNGPLCAGAMLQLTVVPPPNVASYSWTGPSNFSSNLQNPAIPNASAANAGTYTLTVTGNDGSTNTSTTTVQVNPRPMPVFNYNSPICVGQSVVVNAGMSTPVNGIANFRYDLNNDGIYEISTANSSSTFNGFTTPGSFTVGMQLRTAQNCTYDTSFVVQVYDKPALTLSVEDNVICMDTAFNYVANVALVSPPNLPSAINDYRWDFESDGAIDQNGPALNTIPNYLFPNAGTYTTTVVTTTDAGCADTASIQVIQHPLPTASASTNAPVCENHELTLSSSGGSSYSWTGPGGYTSYNQNIVINPAVPANSGTYQVLVTDANSCQDSATVDVTVNATPDVDFTADTLAGCEPLTVNFINNSTISDATPLVYQWTIDGYGPSASANPNVVYATEGSYDAKLIVTSDQGCSDSLFVNDMINVYNVPTASFTSSPQPTTIGDPEISFTNTSSADVNQWNWDFAGLGSATFSDPTYSFPSADTFLVTLIVSTQYGCSDTTRDTIILDDLTEIWIPNSFTPDEDGLNDNWFPVGRNLDTKNVAIEVSVFDRWGQNVFYSNTSDKPWNGQLSNGEEECPQGAYVYKVYFLNEQGIEKTYQGNVNLIK